MTILRHILLTYVELMGLACGLVIYARLYVMALAALPGWWRSLCRAMTASWAASGVLPASGVIATVLLVAAAVAWRG